MTLSEFFDAVQGFNDLEESRLKWQFVTTRKICYYICISQGVKIDGRKIEEKDIISIKELDEHIEKARRESLPVIEVKIDGTD